MELVSWNQWFCDPNQSNSGAVSRCICFFVSCGDYKNTKVGKQQTNIKSDFKFYKITEYPPSFTFSNSFQKGKRRKMKRKGDFFSLFVQFSFIKKEEKMKKWRFSRLLFALFFFLFEEIEEKRSGKRRNEVQFIFSFLLRSLDFHFLWKRVENEIEFVRSSSIRILKEGKKKHISSIFCLRFEK